MRLPILPVAELTRKDQYFHCEPLKATLSVAACLKRQGPPPKDDPRRYWDCVNPEHHCPIGLEIAARVTAPSVPPAIELGTVRSTPPEPPPTVPLPPLMVHPAGARSLDALRAHIDQQVQRVLDAQAGLLARIEAQAVLIEKMDAQAQSIARLEAQLARVIEQTMASRILRPTKPERAAPSKKPKPSKLRRPVKTKKAPKPKPKPRVKAKPKARR